MNVEQPLTLWWQKKHNKKIWHRSLNPVVNEICNLVAPVWRRINWIANSIKVVDLLENEMGTILYITGIMVSP
jgi:hypothetical protein